MLSDRLTPSIVYPPYHPRVASLNPPIVYPSYTRAGGDPSRLIILAGISSMAVLYFVSRQPKYK